MPRIPWRRLPLNPALVEVRVAPALADIVTQLQALHEAVMALPDLKTLEPTVHEALKRIDRLTMETLLVEKIKSGGAATTREVRCRHCASGWAVSHEPAAPRPAVTVRGRVDFTRPVYRCDQPGCARARAPVDEELGLAPKAHYTRLLENEIAWAGTTAASFAQASAQPVENVDFYHAAENLAKARDEIFVDGESAPAKTWYDRWRHRLHQGEVDAVIEELDRRARAAKDEQRCDALGVRKNYFVGHRERMRYPEYEALGLPIGSEANEGTCKNLGKGRMAGVGMRWDAEEGIELMTALRVRLFNQRWEDLWAERQDPDAAAA